MFITSVVFSIAFSTTLELYFYIESYAIFDKTFSIKLFT